jgi:hypothetical protein
MITFTHLSHYGRLGNMLFELAACISLAIRNNDKYIFPTWEYEKYFNLHNCFSNNIVPTQTYKEPYFHYAKIPNQNTTNEVLDLKGFFQSVKYFEDNQDIIRNLLTPNIGFGMKHDYTSIHVRKGDYTKLTQEYQQLDMSYYQAAMDIVKSKYYLVVSDDIAWCKQNFKGDNIFFSEGKSPVEDLALQISCENNIISNSTFGWWGAWLNSNPSKMIVSPKRWFGPKMPHDEKDLLPTEWTQI